MKKILNLSKCMPYDTLLVILLLLLSIVYLINFMNNKYVDDKYAVADDKYASLKKNNTLLEKFEEKENDTGNENDTKNDTENDTEELEKKRIIEMITLSNNSYLEAQRKYDESSNLYSKTTLEYNEAIEKKESNEILTELSDKRNNASSSIYVNLRELNDTKDRLDNLKKQYPEEYSLVVTGSVAKDLDKVEKKHVQPNIIHNHYNQYYGGNPEMTKFLQQLTNKLDNNKQEGDLNLMDQGMCSELNNKLSTMTLAEFKNNRFVQDLKSKCEKSDGVDCSFRPTNSQTALLGTLLEDAKKTKVGDILPKEEISTDY